MFESQQLVVEGEAGGHQTQGKRGLHQAPQARRAVPLIPARLPLQWTACWGV